MVKVDPEALWLLVLRALRRGALDTAALEALAARHQPDADPDLRRAFLASQLHEMRASGRLLITRTDAGDDLVTATRPFEAHELGDVYEVIHQAVIKMGHLLAPVLLCVVLECPPGLPVLGAEILSRVAPFFPDWEPEALRRRVFAVLAELTCHDLVVITFAGSREAAENATFTLGEIR